MSGAAIHDYGRLSQVGLEPQVDNKPLREGQEAGKSFGDALESALQKVDSSLESADQMATGYISGAGGDLHDVLIRMEQADLQFRTMMQVRNKLLEAYKEIMRIQV